MENGKLFELMTKMYGDMQEGFKRLDSEVSGLKEDISSLKQGQTNIKDEVKEFRTQTMERFDSVEDKLNDLEATNATNHIDTNAKLNKVSDDLDFLSHKEFQTEKEMYHIKQKLMNRKRRVK